MYLKDSFGDLYEIVLGFAEIKNGYINIRDITKLIDVIPKLINSPRKDINNSKALYYLVLSAAHQSGIYPSSPQKLYKAKGDGSIKHSFLNPVIDCTQDSLEHIQQIFKAQNTLGFHLGCLGMKIDNGVIDHYSVITKIISAAILESYTSPIFLQAGNIKFDFKRFNEGRDHLMDEIREKVKSLINAGIYNLTLDASELIEENRSDPLEKLLMNLKMVAMATNLWVRKYEPRGLTVAVGCVLKQIAGIEINIAVFKDYIKRLYKEGSRLRFNTAGEDIVKITIPNILNTDKPTIKSMNEFMKRDFGMGGLVLELGEVNTISTVNEHMGSDFCEVNFNFSNSLKTVDNYSSLFSSLSNSEVNYHLSDYLLKRDSFPRFEDL